MRADGCDVADVGADPGVLVPVSRDRRRGRRRARPVALAVALALLAGACGSAQERAEGPADTADRSAADVVVEDPDGDPVAGGRLVYALVAESNSWDPGSAQWATSGRTVAAALFDTLTTWNADGDAVPFLAESVEANEALTEWDVTVRSGVTFHDGSPLDAEAVAGSIRHATTSPSLGAVFRGLESIEAVDERTVRLTFSQPFAILPEALATQAGVVVAPAMLAAGDEAGRQPIGTGPFRFVEWVPNDRLVVERNDDYWREGLPYLDAIEFRVFPDSQTRRTALQADEVDMIEATEPGLVDALLELAEAGEVQVMTNLDAGEGAKSLVVFNTERPPLDDLRVRQAVVSAIDTEAISAAASRGRNAPASSIFSSTSPYFDDTGYPRFDPDAARRLVEEVEAEQGPITFALNSPPDPDVTSIAQQIQVMLADVGIDVTIDGLDQTALIAAAVSGSYDATLFRLWGAPRPDTGYVFVDSGNLRSSGISLNVARLVDPDLQAAVDAMLATRDPEAKAQAYVDLQAAMSASLPMAFLLRSTAAVGAVDSVRGFDSWELPDGTPGLAQNETVPSLAQVWLDR